MKLDAKNCTITVTDGTPTTPKSADVKLGEGNITWTEHSEHVYTLNRGKLNEVRLGDEQPLEINFDSELEWYTGDILGILKGGAGYLTTDTDPCRPYSCTLKIVHTVKCGETTTTETYTFPFLRVDSKNFDLTGGKFSITAKCNVLAPTVAKT